MKTITHYIQAITSIADARKAANMDHKIGRPIVIIESDDWGSIRMPSSKVLEELKSKGHRYFDDIGYDRYDTLASNTDLEVLIDALSSVKDSIGNTAKMTMNCVLANPDFDKIRQTDYHEYHYELFTETLKRYPHHDRSYDLWKEGIKQGVLHPQFHGREHLNPQMWLQLLQNGVPATVDSFRQQVISSIVDKSIDARTHSLAAYNIANENEYAFAKESVREGLILFEQLFGYRSTSMIAPNYTWDTAIEDVAAQCGVKYIQGSRNQRHSYYVMRNGGRTEVRHTGQKNGNGQIYLVRNCSFEPSETSRKNADYCMAQVEKAFRQGQAAIISSHRQNFIGELHPENRNNNIKQFKSLLTAIVKTYPNTMFMTSDEYGALLELNTNNNI